MFFRACDLLIDQRTQMVNALRGRLAEHGIIVGKGLGNVDRLAALIMSHNLPELVQIMSELYLRQIGQAGEEIIQIDSRIAAEAREGDVVRRLQKMPGIEPICAMAITAFAPSMREFRCGRDFAVWLGLVPLTSTTLDWRQTEARPHVEDGSTRYPTALEHARAKAVHVGGYRDGEQNGANDLGHACA